MMIHAMTIVGFGVLEYTQTSVPSLYYPKPVKLDLLDRIHDQHITLDNPLFLNREEPSEKFSKHPV